MNKNDISLIINCKKEDIKNIDCSIFKDKYSKIYFNINNLDNIINIIDTKYYNILDYNKDYKQIINNYYIIDSNNIIDSYIIYNKLLYNDYIIITKNNNLKVQDLQSYIKLANLNKIFCIYDEKNQLMILFHNLIYYFPIEYITFESLIDIYNTINIYKINTYILSPINTQIINNINNNICIHLMIHNINYHLSNILKYFKTYISDYIYIYNINSYDGIDYELICNNYDYNYTFVDDIENLPTIIQHNIYENKNNLLINLIDDHDYSIENISNIIHNYNFKNIHILLTNDHIFN